MSKWFGVNGSKSLGSLEAGVSGRLFMMPSAITSNVVSISEVMICSRVSPDRIRLMDLICLSQAPPMCEAVGVLNSHRTPFSLRSQVRSPRRVQAWATNCWREPLCPLVRRSARPDNAASVRGLSDCPRFAVTAVHPRGILMRPSHPTITMT